MTPQEFQRRFGAAAQAFQQGKYDEAARAAKALLTAAPGQPDASHLYGLSLFQGGKGAEALDPLRKAATNGNPDYVRSLAIVLRECGQRPEAINVLKIAGGGAGPLAGLLGILYLEENDLPKAAAALRAATSQNPQDVEAFINLGIAEQMRDRKEQAETAFSNALALRPENSGTRVRVAALMQARGALVEAEQLLRASPNNPLTAEETLALAEVLRAGGATEDAKIYAATAATAMPDNVDTALLQSAIALDEGDFDAARGHLETALRIDPTSRAAEINLALVDHTSGAWDDARARLTKLAEGEDPGQLAAYHLAQVERDLGDFAAARSTIDQVIAARPDNADAIFERAHLTLMEGDLAAGFADYEARWGLKARKEGRLPVRPSMGLPEWDGASAARVLLLAEQGFGDTIMFSRFAEDAARKASALGLYCSTELEPLLLPSLDSVQVTASLTAEDGAKNYDAELPLMSLPHKLGLSTEEMTAPRTWLKVPEDAAAKWADKLSALSGFKIGLVWSGNPEFARQGRWLTFDQLAPLMALEGPQWVSLQLGPAREEAANVPAHFHDWTDKVNNFADTAALVESCDLVLTVDTALSHVAGGLGKPFWLMNRFQSEWRWQRNRTDSPWYPTAKLFNQPEPGAWAPVIETVAKELRSLI